MQGNTVAVELPQESSSQWPCAAGVRHAWVLSPEKKAELQQGHLLPHTCWGDTGIPTQIQPWRGTRGAAKQTWVPCLPLLLSWQQQTPPEVQLPWVADSIPHPQLWRFVPQCHFKRPGLHQIPVPKPPSRAQGRRHSPRCWSLHCCAAVGNPNSQTNPPNPLGAITPRALRRQNTHLAIYMICDVKCLSDNSLGTAALAISSVKYFQNPKVLREKSSYFD